MAVAWGTAADVRELIEKKTSMGTAEIDEVIEQCEGFFKAILRIPDTFTFDAAKKGHKLLRNAVELRAALICMSIESWDTLQEYATKANIIYDMYVDAKKFLVDPANRGTWDIISEA